MTRRVLVLIEVEDGTFPGHHLAMEFSLALSCEEVYSLPVRWAAGAPTLPVWESPVWLELTHRL